LNGLASKPPLPAFLCALGGFARHALNLDSLLFDFIGQRRSFLKNGILNGENTVKIFGFTARE
jgi:hypothetical protein